MYISKYVLVQQYDLQPSSKLRSFAVVIRLFNIIFRGIPIQNLTKHTIKSGFKNAATAKV